MYILDKILLLVHTRQPKQNAGGHCDDGLGIEPMGLVFRGLGDWSTLYFFHTESIWRSNFKSFFYFMTFKKF
jgi:hypothetical protein